MGKRKNGNIFVLIPLRFFPFSPFHLILIPKLSLKVYL